MTLRLFSMLVAASACLPALAQNPVNYVDPLIGTDGHGHAFPGATVPFGMVQLSPDTRTDTWDGSSGYHYSDKSILGFSHTHLAGTGVGCMGDIMLMPTIGTSKIASSFSHAAEKAKPGYYSAFLSDPKILAELTSTARAGFSRFTYPASKDAHLLLDLTHGISNDTKDCSMTIENPTTISGWRKSGGWGGERVVFFVLQTSKPFSSVTIDDNKKHLADGLKQAQGKLRAWLNYTTFKDEQVQVRVGISGTSVEGARKNLQAEIPKWDFDGVAKASSDKWSQSLKAIEVKSTDEKALRTFYSNAYMSYLAPSLFNDADGSYMGMDHKVHEKARFNNYSTFSLWDTYRALHPLLTLTQPKVVPDMTSSLVAEFKESGYGTTPVWPLWGNETWCMIGYHSVPVIVDAYFKGILGPDAETAYQAIKTTSMGDRFGLKSYRELGYTASKPGEQATSKTIEWAVDDWCIAQMAAALGHTQDADMFYKRAAYYRNHFDGTTRLFRGRKADGSWRAPFDQLGLVGDEYTEADAWQYAFTVQQDVPGMISLYGGDQKFIERMDEMFNLNEPIHTGIPDITGLIGQYAQGNEQCHHQAYLYVYAGAPWKTQEALEKINKFYTDKPDGQIGNNDCGQMSAWYVFSALGFYPVNPAAGVYIIGSPTFPSATVNLDNGKKFTVTTTGSGPYVQSAMLNGKPLTRAWIRHSEIMDGGTMSFVKGTTPNKGWGLSEVVRPPATMPANFKYQPLPEPSSDKPVVLSLPIRVVAGEDDEIEGFVGDPNMLSGSTNRANVRVDTAGVANAAPARVYQSERYGKDFTHSFPVPEGKYTVRLHFAEVFEDVAGQRIENIDVNGKRVLTNFDVVALAGPNKALVREFKGVTPVNGKMTIRVMAAPGSPDQNAKISAIEIIAE